MSLYQTAVRKPITTVLIYVAIAIIGVFSLSRLSIDLLYIRAGYFNEAKTKGEY